jgi:hypothetical protein
MARKIKMPMAISDANDSGIMCFRYSDKKPRGIKPVTPKT